MLVTITQIIAAIKAKDWLTAAKLILQFIGDNLPTTPPTPPTTNPMTAHTAKTMDELLAELETNHAALKANTASASGVWNTVWPILLQVLGKILSGVA